MAGTAIRPDQHARHLFAASFVRNATACSIASQINFGAGRDALALRKVQRKQFDTLETGKSARSLLSTVPFAWYHDLSRPPAIKTLTLAWNSKVLVSISARNNEVGLPRI